MMNVPASTKYAVIREMTQRDNQLAEYYLAVR